jgi:hypothetical protein
VARYDEDGTTPTGLSLAASWGNLNWAMDRMLDAYSEYAWESYKLRRMAYKVIHGLQVWHDRLSVHAVVPSLVKQEQLPEFLDILDRSCNATNPKNKSRWLEGQQKKAFLSFLDGWNKERHDQEDEYSYDTQNEL